MSKEREVWVSNREQTLAGEKVGKGQIVKPTGAIHDNLVFNANSRWAYRTVIVESVHCDTDGCKAEFVGEAHLFRHREIVHKPERDAREKARLAALDSAKQAEDEGYTIGGHEIVKTKQGPGGEVPYIQPPM